jgi:acetate kinase
MTVKPDEPLIRVINAGSSSLKFSFYEAKNGFLLAR